MAVLPESMTAKLDYQKRIASGQIVVEVVLASKVDAPIAKVLSISASAIVSPTETFVGECRYSGKLTYSVLYLDDDGKNQILEHVVDFSDKLLSEQITLSTRAILTATVLDTDTINASSSDIRLATVVDIKLDAVIRNEFKILTGGSDGIYTHDDTIECYVCKNDTNDNFVISDSYVDSKMIKLLSSEYSIFVKNIKSGIDTVTVDGIISTNMCIEIEGQMTKSIVHNTNFTQELAAGGAVVDSKVTVALDVKSFRATMSEDHATISIEANIGARIAIFESSSFSPIIDAFSVTNDLVLTGENIDLTTTKHQKCVEDRIEGTISLQSELPLADVITAITGNRINITASRAEAGRVNVEGVANSSIVYYNADQNTKNSVNVELPFSLSIPDSGVEQSDTVFCKGSVINVSSRIRRGTEIEVKMDIGLEYYVNATKTQYIVSNIELGEELNLPTSAFSIHIAKQKDSLWDIAKSLGCTPEQILTQNPNLVLPLIGGERVMVYRQLSNK